ncbi:MAG: chondroitinase-B domain-containing protein [Planctomycetota bacterium]
MKSIEIFLVCLFAFTFTGFADDRQTEVTGLPEFYSTIHSIGIEWDIIGDSNHNAVCKVEYRKAGEEIWLQGMDLFRVDYKWYYGTEQGKERQNKMAGSILFLAPENEYEVRLTLSDPDGGDEAKVFKTKTENYPSYVEPLKTVYLTSRDQQGDGTRDNPLSINMIGQALTPGSRLVLLPGVYSEIYLKKSGSAIRPVLITSEDRSQVNVRSIKIRGSYLQLENLNFEMGEKPVTAVSTDHVINRGIVIKNCIFKGYNQNIYASRESSSWLIMDNEITGSKNPETDGKSGMSGEGIDLQKSDNHIVCFNKISRVADGISYPGRNCDIYGNDIFDCSDDGIEPDFGKSNVRMWGNRITNIKNNFISFQPMCDAPWYIIRNQCAGKGYVLKLRVFDRFLMANNTFLRWGTAGNHMQSLLKGFSCNNIYIHAGYNPEVEKAPKPVWEGLKNPQRMKTFSEEKQRYLKSHTMPSDFKPDWKSFLDYDGFAYPEKFHRGRMFIWGTVPEDKTALKYPELGNQPCYPDFKSFVEASGIEKNHTALNYKNDFLNYNIPANPVRLNSNLMIELTSDSKAINSGYRLKNIHDNLSDKPDLGAFEFGKPKPHYGVRKTPEEKTSSVGFWIYN